MPDGYFRDPIGVLNKPKPRQEDVPVIDEERGFAVVEDPAFEILEYLALGSRRVGRLSNRVPSFYSNTLSGFLIGCEGDSVFSGQGW